MQKSSNEERLSSETLSANASPQRVTQKTSTFFGLLTKRSIKVEPHPVDEQQQSREQYDVEQRRLSDYSAAKERNLSFAAKCQLQETPQANHHARAKSQTLPTLNSNTNYINSKNNASSTNGKESTGSSSHGLLRLHRKGKSRSKTHGERHFVAEAGSLSDGSEVIMRKSAASGGKHRSPNHNRFSHQFSLCCKAEKKPMTPPVTVRYNSVPDTANVVRRDNQSLNWSLTNDNASLSLNSSDVNLVATAADIQLKQQPSLLVAPAVEQQECVSAPESPAATKSLCGEQLPYANSSLSNTSVRSGPTTGTGPIRPIAVSACRSRLRLKLYPPDKELPALYTSCLKQAPSKLETMKRATTPQHMSSPNICTQRDFVGCDIGDLNDCDIVRFRSHENILMPRQSSGTGLARQSLMAAQMLSLIPTEKARERLVFIAMIPSPFLFFNRLIQQ